MSAVAVFTAFATDGHVNPVFAIAEEVQRAGVETHVITHAKYMHQYSFTGLLIWGIDEEGAFYDLNRDIELLSRPRTVPEFFRRHVFPSVNREVAALLSALGIRKGVVVTTDSPGLAARLAAEVSKNPLVSLFTAPGFLISRPLYAEMLISEFTNDLETLRKQFALPAKSVQDFLGIPVLSVAMWPRWFFDGNNSNSSLRHVGFVWCDEPSPAGESFKKEEGSSKRVLITGGSGTVGGKRFFELSTEACGEAGTVGTVITKHREYLPSVLPKGLVWKAWVPNLMDSLANCDIVIHHGGMGTTSRAIVVGRPQLVLAMGGDRPQNGKCIEALGLGGYVRLGVTDVGAVSKEMIRICASKDVRMRTAERSNASQKNGALLAAEMIVAIARRE